ncbi:P-loop containing nucleoside triphosphate hydrolase protein [Hygrophoropsis aurantiaca]|uniref:P-loop containing nucleoside triphosphate hydrolase protein n=1 Tax=Hygrophoropsis aurantiaca TaxID=72124 RepID=A0ACB8AL50_9AGAM|nr:P-loop containing nucleoside triphosphate hydrolase protein [Hygrophoropsis aurantiaca]
MAPVQCPICSHSVSESNINKHLDSNCSGFIITSETAASSKEKPRISGKVAPIFNQQKERAPLDGFLSAAASSDASRASSSQKRKINEPSMSQSINKRLKGSTSQYSTTPLAERLRPQHLSDFIGQKHLTGPESLLMNMLETGTLGSMIFWGPPGCGKTTLARLLAQQMDAVIKELSATSSGINDVRTVFEEAKNVLTLTGRRTVLFLDEIHRFNKSQQDIFLPYIERGQIQLIGATTENPSFKLTGALISRCRVFVLNRLTDDDVKDIIHGALGRVGPSGQSTELGEPSSQITPSEPSTSQTVWSQPDSSPVSKVPARSSYPAYPQLTEKVIDTITSLSTGDARTALSLLELVLTSRTESKEETLLSALRQSVSTSYDRTGESHYDMISALHKSVRGSQGSAAMYWLARMLGAGEDPLYIARRMVVCASEDIGLADVHALPLAMATFHACQAVGMPECRINLAHLVAYLSETQKSTRAYNAYKRAEEAAKLDMTMPVPMQMRNAPTNLMKELGYGEDYRYNPEYLHPVHNDYLPIPLRDDKFLKDAEDLSDKVWDEDALAHWEREANGGQQWDGRIQHHNE